MNPKRKTLTLADKIKLIEAVKTGSRQAKDIANEFEIPVSTLSTILKNEKEIMQNKMLGAGSQIAKEKDKVNFLMWKIVCQRGLISAEKNCCYQSWVKISFQSSSFFTSSQIEE